MININWFHLLLQRPLATILIFALISCSILIFLQTIADRPAQDDPVQTIILGRRNIAESQHVHEAGSKRTSNDAPKGSGGPLELEELNLRINDLKRIKASVREELRSLQREKTKILREKASLISKNEKILSQISGNKNQLKQLELDISADQKQRSGLSCKADVVMPIIFNPLRSIDIEDYAIHKEPAARIERAHESATGTSTYEFDMSLCPLTKLFSFNSTFSSEWLSNIEDDSSTRNLDLTTLFGVTLKSHQQYKRSHEACMTVILLSDLSQLPEVTTRNNLIINLANQPIDMLSHESIFKNALIASSSFTAGSFRRGLDIVIPSIIKSPESYDSLVNSIPLQSPLDRRYLASYFGDKRPTQRDSSDVTDRTLQTIHRSSIDDRFLFIYDCGAQSNKPCYDEREKMLEMSTFHIIIPSSASRRQSHDIDHNTNDLIYMALAKGSLPVIIGDERVTRLPFDEVIDWRRCALLLPRARLPELHFILRSLGASDLYALKYAGRRVIENYLATARQVLDATISVISLNRLKYPPLPIAQARTETYFQSKDLLLDVNCSLPACQEAKSEMTINSLLPPETLGPREIPFASAAFARNFSLALSGAYDLWNSPMHSPYHLYPSHPHDPVVPSEYKFLSADPSYRPIGDGLGGSGREFSESLGGDYPNEQFTIVLLTYERVELMMKTLERLTGLAYLNKVIIVWNGINQAPPSDLIWPNIGVPIVLVKVPRNSLNNRFLPYDAIETDAIFSMDDDSPLRPDEIVFAFRVWRESRDRIVGFPGRFHAWDGYQNSWMYNSNHSCELSMVLTGGAFFHKYYSFVYSQIMPETIRSIVDKFMNCEDIAMNFLVAHLTRKPPIKVTSRWTFHCATCTSSLSEDDTHFMERHECLNIFTSIYGYMPLLNTQHRSDSILFKTRLPRDKQKCYRFV